MTKQHLSLNDFARVDIRGAFRFEIVKSDKYDVVLERDWRLHPTASVRGDTLVISEPWYDLVHWITPWVSPWVRVEMPELRELRVSGASRGSTTGFTSYHDFKLSVRGASQVTGDFTSDDCDFDVAGASKIQLGASAKVLRLKVAGASRLSGSLQAEKGDIHVVGASRMDVKGQMGDAVIDVAGASPLDLANLTVRNAGIKLLGASQCSLSVSGRMDAELAGASRLVYGGNPVMGNIRAVGASSLTRR